MRLFTTISLGLALVLGCVLPASANPAFVQSVSCGSTTSCAFGSPPVNGHVITVILANTATVTGVTVTDSHSNTLTEHQPASNCVVGSVFCLAAFDYIATGGPGTTYTFTGLTSSGVSGFTGCMAELSGALVVGANYGANAAATIAASGTLVATIAGVTNHDALMGFSDAVTNSPNTVVISNGPIANKCQNFIGPAGLATSTSSTTNTATWGAGGSTSAAIIMVDYPTNGINGPGGTPVQPGNVYPGGSQFPPYTNSYIPQPDWGALCD